MITQIVAGLSIASMADARMQSFLGTSGSMKEMGDNEMAIRSGESKKEMPPPGVPANAIKLPDFNSGKLKKVTQQEGTGAEKKRVRFIPLNLPVQAGNTEQIDMEKLKEEMNQKLEKASAPTNFYSAKNGGGLKSIPTEEDVFTSFQRALTVRLVENGKELAERAEEAEAEELAERAEEAEAVPERADIKQVIHLKAGDDNCLPDIVDKKNPAGKIRWDFIRTKEYLPATECQCRNEKCEKEKHTFCLTLFDGKSGICT